ncbi:MAG: class I SAM-dependent DNA methyltransferase [Segniliparus sp.]|uniref:class I SAM-dependent DNA methyltransferase n=1 Tax=Segniliparus sp. TaxID=2804064 RepID=UPI003F3833CC
MDLADYDLIARDYADACADELERKPFDRAVLTGFARLVAASGGSTALDAGCGPGHAAVVLAEAGLAVEGVDASPAMAALAEERLPGRRFAVGDMTALPHGDAAFHAVCAWYSIIHTPAAGLGALFAELGRVLAPGGWLLLAFQTEAPTLDLDEAFGRRISLRFLRHEVAAVHAALRGAGFDVFATAKRERDIAQRETAAQAFVIAKKPRPTAAAD